MRISAGLFVFIAGLNASVVLAACEMPDLVASIPDGATATENELLAVQAEVRAYVEAMDDFIACQNEAMRVEDEETTDVYLLRMSQRIESARNEVDQVAAEFNDQVNAFRAARQAAPGIP